MDNICSICLEESPDVITQCNHQFHKSCLDEWLKIRTNCPLCRSVFSSEFKIKGIYNKFIVNDDSITFRNRFYSKTYYLSKIKNMKIQNNKLVLNVFIKNNLKNIKFRFKKKCHSIDCYELIKKIMYSKI